VFSGETAVVNLYGADLSGVDLHSATLSMANLGEPPPNSLPSRVQEGDLEGPHAGSAGKTKLNGADLEGASLESAILPGFDLTEANLKNANLKKIALGGGRQRGREGTRVLSSLVGADLTCADLSNADLRAIDWSGANLTMTNLSGALMGPTNNITQEQVDQAFGDENTDLRPRWLQTPTSWNEDGEVEVTTPPDERCLWQLEEGTLLDQQGQAAAILGKNRKGSPENKKREK
jgi:uncharacterized protein YjbI with pentapeptide repeats